MPDYDVTIRPHQPWGLNGTADVWKIETGGKMTLLGILPLRHEDSPKQYPVPRNQNPNGLLIINRDNLPQETTAMIKLREDNTNEIIVPCHGWPNGHGGAHFI